MTNQSEHAMAKGGMILCIDFDGTLVAHEFPEIGRPVPGAFQTLKDLQERGHKLILWTMRSDGQANGPVLTQAVEFCRKQGIEFWGVNSNPEQHTWTSSPKQYAQVYIDDAALGCPLLPHIIGGKERPMVDWNKVREWFGLAPLPL